MVPLLDVNVLIALVWPVHVHHELAHQWFAQNHQHGWSTCPLTQLGFVRVSMQPAVVKTPIPFGDAWRALEQMIANPTHQFWPIESGLLDVRPELRRRVSGHQQLADAVLLELAIRHHGRLVTFDRRAAGLLTPDSPHQSSLEIISP